MARSPRRVSGHLGLVRQAAGEGESATQRPSRVSLSLVVDRDRRDVGDGDLARALVADEPWAVSEAWHRFAPMVLVMAERCLGSKSEAEDLAQEVFYRVFRKAKTLREPDSLRSFVYSFAIRMLRTELRRRRLRSWLALDQPEAMMDAGHRTLEVEARDHLRRFYVLLDRLTPRDRLVFTLRRMESMTIEETARQLGLSPSTVKRSLSHASDRLSRWIEADPGLGGLLDKERWGR